MSKTAWALIGKFVLTFVAAWLAFSFINNNTLMNIFVVALLGTVLNYLIGDLLLLPSLGNVTASVIDGVLGAITAYIYGLLIPKFSTTLTSLVLFAVVIMVAEYFFHKYLLSTKKVAPNTKE